MMEVRQMSKGEIHRLATIDPTESGKFVYYYRGGEVVVEEEEWHRPRWSDEETQT